MNIEILPHRESHPGDSKDIRERVITYRIAYPAGHVIARHRHFRAQLLHAVEGVMNVTTADGTWTVPPQQAVWIPPAIDHEVRCASGISMRSLYIHPRAVPRVASMCQVVHVTPLLRELIARMVAGRASAQARQRLMAVIMDELQVLDSPPLHLPAPRDSRLAQITTALTRDPADARDLEQWSHLAGASARTLARLFKRETGMSFGAWRRQLRLMNAVYRLGAGHSVTRVALDLGYHSPSAFVAMFRRSLGAPPARFIRGPAPPAGGLSNASTRAARSFAPS